MLPPPEVALVVRPTDYPLRLVQQHNVRLEFKTSKPSGRHHFYGLDVWVWVIYYEYIISPKDAAIPLRIIYCYALEILGSLNISVTSTISKPTKSG
jgi:hypothetical protein